LTSDRNAVAGGEDSRNMAARRFIYEAYTSASRSCMMALMTYVALSRVGTVDYPCAYELV
jgi:hypothetical protein